MEICVTLKIFVTFIFLQHAFVWTLSDNTNISERLLILEDMLTEMENIVRESDVKVRKAQGKLEDTQETLERDFTRLQKSEERKMRKGYRKIVKEVRNEFKNDNRLIKEMIQDVKDINLKGADNPERHLNNITRGLKRLNGHLDENQDQDTARSEGKLSFYTLFKSIYRPNSSFIIYKLDLPFFTKILLL